MTTVPRDGIEALVFEVFRDVVDRVPTQAERADWAGKLSRGVPIRELRTRLEASPESVALRALSHEIKAVRETGLFDAALALPPSL